jgi:hypothetical protein
MPEEIDWKKVAEKLTTELARARTAFAQLAAAANTSTQVMDSLLEEWHDKMKESDGDI